MTSKGHYSNYILEDEESHPSEKIRAESHRVAERRQSPHEHDLGDAWKENRNHNVSQTVLTAFEMFLIWESQA
jgi:hypothetical protein